MLCYKFILPPESLGKYTDKIKKKKKKNISKAYRIFLVNY